MMIRRSKPILTLTSFFSIDDIRIAPGASPRDEALRLLLRALAANHGLADETAYLAEILARQAAGSTILAPGVAIPHARIDAITRPYLSLGIFPEGVILEDGEPPVRIIFLVLIPLKQPALYLQILRAVGEILTGDDDAARALAACQTPLEAMRIFEHGGTPLPPFVSANDIMCTHVAPLRENDSLRMAIDVFTTGRLDEIPVVDAEGDLIGVVNTRALMQLCLPDYLLWSRDLSAMQQFEPFSAVLQNEQNAWLRDIITQDYVAVQAEAPAIQAAVEMARRRLDRCYVLHGRQLVGEIPLTRFLEKVFRD